MRCYAEETEIGIKTPKKRLWCKYCGYDAVFIEPHLSAVVKSQTDQTVVDWIEMGGYYYHYSPDYGLGCHQRIGIFTDRMDTLTDIPPDNVGE